MAMDGVQAFPKSTLESARKTKLTMENFYDNLLIQDRDRTNRWRKLDLSMEEMALSTDEVMSTSCVCNGLGVCVDEGGTY